MPEAQRRLAAIVANDVAGFSRLMGQDEQGTLTRLKEHRAATDPIGERHGGRLVGTADGGRCVDLFRRPEGTFGFEEFRRDHEDPTEWFKTGYYSDLTFKTETSALIEA